MYENHATHSIAGGVSIAAKLHGFRVLSTLKLFPANRKNSPSLLPLLAFSCVTRSSSQPHPRYIPRWLRDGRYPVLWKIYFTARSLSAVVAEEIGRKLDERFIPIVLLKQFFKDVIK